jgi:hypothetical protein
MQLHYWTACIVAPRMHYAVAIWHRPRDARTASTTSQLTKMASLQRQIMRTITGCFRTTLKASLEFETAFPPAQSPQRNVTLGSIT